jgi:hypothetical protein
MEEAQILFNLSNEVKLTSNRLLCAPTGMRACRLSYRHLQRLVLEFEAMSDYLCIYKCKMRTAVDVASPGERNGALVHNGEEAQWFFNAAIRYWLVRPVNAFVEVRVDDLAPLLTPPDVGFSPAPVSFPER